jgi:hypothetical protein
MAVPPHEDAMAPMGTSGFFRSSWTAVRYAMALMAGTTSGVARVQGMDMVRLSAGWVALQYCCSMATWAILMREEYLHYSITEMRGGGGIRVLGRGGDDIAVVVLPAHVRLHVALAGAEEHVAEKHIVEGGARAGGADEGE